MPIDWSEFDKKFKHALIKAGADTGCARCGKKSYAILRGFFNHPVNERFDEVNELKSGVITAVLICKNCAWIAEHSLEVLGLGEYISEPSLVPEVEDVS